MSLGITSRTFERQPWMADAACRGMHTRLFFPPRGGDARLPKEVCASCPVRVECLDEAVRNLEKHGVWGGLSERERRQERKRRRSRT